MKATGMGSNMQGHTPIFHCVLRNRIFLAQNVPRPVGNYVDFPMDRYLRYEPVNNDFGPESISSICRFVEAINNCVESNQDSRIVCTVGQGNDLLTNAILLLGAYILFRYGMHPSEVWEMFRIDCSVLIERRIVEYRDSSASAADATLNLLDCWQALYLAATLDWIKIPNLYRGPWGLLDIDEYEHYESALNGDFVQVKQTIVKTM